MIIMIMLTISFIFGLNVVAKFRSNFTNLTSSTSVNFQSNMIIVYYYIEYYFDIYG